MENNILWLLLEITVSSAVIYCVIMLFKNVFKHKISPYLQYAMWWLLILRLILPFTLNVNFRLIQIGNAVEITAGNEPDGRQARLNAAASAAPISLTISSDINGLNNGGSTIHIQSTQPAPFTGITWQQWALTVWIAGAAIGLTKPVLSGIGLKKQLKNTAVETPSHIRRIFSTCRRRLDIKNRLRVLTVGGVKTPALTLSLCPTLIIPQDMAEEGDARQIYFALTHELTHYKRRDHLCCLLLQVLKAVYWFNPFVRLAEKEIRMDIECACDAGVVSKMAPDTVSGYAKALIKLSSGANIGYALGMALDSAFKAVEKRIRGIYMIKKSKPGAVIAALLIAPVVLISCFTTACVPIQKANEPSPAHSQTDAQSINIGNSATGVQLDTSKPQSMTNATVAPVALSGNDTDEGAPGNTGGVPTGNIMPIEVAESAIWREDNRLKYVFAVYNPNKNYAVKSPCVNIRAYDSQGQIISDEIASGRYILPESYWYYSEASSEKVSEEPAKSEFIPIVTQDVNYVMPHEIENLAPNVKIEIDSADKTGINGRGIYPSSEDTQPVTVVAMYRVDRGDLTGACRFVLNATLEDGVTAPIKILFDGDEKYITDNVEFHVQPWS